MKHDERKVQKAHRQLRRLRTVGAGRADLSRLVVEPVLSWIGWQVDDPLELRRQVAVLSPLPPADFVCLERGEPYAAVWVLEELSDQGAAAFRGAVQFARQAGVRSLPQWFVLTDGERWWAFEQARDGSDLILATLEHPARLLALEPTEDGPDKGAEDGPTKAPTPEREAPAHPPVSANPGSRPPTRRRVTAPSPTRDRSNQPYFPAPETHTSPTHVIVDGKRQQVDDWWEVVLVAARVHLRLKGSLPTGKMIPRQRRSYFARNPEKLNTRPQKVAQGWWMEACLSASLAHKIATVLLRDAGLKRRQFRVEFR